MDPNGKETNLTPSHSPEVSKGDADYVQHEYDEQPTKRGHTCW